MSKYFFPCFCVLFLLCSCNDKKDEIERKMLQMKSEKVRLQFNSLAVVKSEKEMYVRPFKLVRFIAVDFCVPCIVHKLNSLSCDDMQGRVSDCVILSISPYDYPVLLHRLKTLEKYPSNLFIDTLDVFRKHNPQIPDEEMFHTFLLDKNDSVVLVGDPIRNARIADLLKKVVNGEIKK